jgi:hypothetical protein
VFSSGDVDVSSFEYDEFQFGKISYNQDMSIAGAYFVEFDTESDSDDDNFYEEEVQFNLANTGV